MTNPESSMPQRIMQPLVDQYAQIRDRIVGEGTGEEGFIVPISPMLAKKIGAVLMSPVLWIGGGAAVGVGGGFALAFGQQLQNGMRVETDLNKAQTKSDYKIIEFKKESKLDIATAYFQLSTTATHIPFKIAISGAPDLHFDANKEMDGFGASGFNLPINDESIKRSLDTTDGKTDFEIDLSKLGINVFWPGAGPEIRNFTINKGGKVRNYNDRSGFRNSMVSGMAAVGGALNVNKLKNSIEDADNNVNHDLKVKGLEMFEEACAPNLGGPIREAAKEALINAVETLGDGDKIGDITFADTALKFTNDKINAPKSAGKAYDHQESLNQKNLKIDNVACYMDEATAVQKGMVKSDESSK